MKNLALLLAISLLLSSCSLMDKDEVNTVDTTIIGEEVSIDTDENINSKESITEINQEGTSSGIKVLTGSTELEKENSSQIETEVRSELSSDIESEEALNEVFNEIEELFELAEQNSGQ